MSPEGPGASRLATLRKERERFQLLCTCEACIHSVPASGDNATSAPACGLGFPNPEHLEQSLVRGNFVFCKSFEAT